MRYRLVIDLLGNAGSGSGTLYYKDLANSGSWTMYPGLNAIDMLIDSNSINQDNLGLLDGFALYQDADATSWDDILVQTNCTQALGSDAVNFENVSIFPNPTNGRLQMDLTGLKDVRFELKNSHGQLLNTRELTGGGLESIELNQPSGFYFVTLKTENASNNYKVLIE